VTKQEATAMIDDIVNENVDKQVQVECSEKVFCRMMEKHPDVVKNISAGLLDPACARKATRATRDAIFYKLCAYICNLNQMGKVPWKSYKDISCESIYRRTRCLQIQQNIDLRLLPMRRLFFKSILRLQRATTK
jgi:hypothetical protein